MIRIDLGLLGTGKTRTAFREARRRSRFCFYTPLKGPVYGRGGHEELKGVPRVPGDSWDHLNRGMEYYFQQARGFYVSCEGNSEAFFTAARTLKNCMLVLDDFPALCEGGEELKCFKRLMPRLAWSGVETWVTAHLPSDIPYKLRNVADQIYWHGPFTGDDYSLKKIYSLRRVDMGFKEFVFKLGKQGKFDVFRIR